MLIENEAMQINFFKWYFTGDVEPHHNHACDPGEEDVGAGLHDIQWIIGIEIFFGPISTNNRPMSTGEPSVKGIVVSLIFDAGFFDYL